MASIWRKLNNLTMSVDLEVPICLDRGSTPLTSIKFLQELLRAFKRWFEGSFAFSTLLYGALYCYKPLPSKKE